MSKLVKMMLILLLPALGWADTESYSVRSAGKMMADTSIDLSRQLQSSTPVTAQRTSAEQPERAARTLALHPIDTVHFELFDVWVDISGDLDHDGYYHNIKVSFDADVDIENHETVYAKIFLSRDAGPWYQIATTDLFEIYSDTDGDSYEVINELETGFRPGYYQVLIELHSLYHSGIVAEQIVDLDSDGYLISLEDRQRDGVFPEHEHSEEVVYEETIEYGVSGSTSIVVLFLLALLLIVKHSGHLTRSC